MPAAGVVSPRSISAGGNTCLRSQSAGDSRVIDEYRPGRSVKHACGKAKTAGRALTGRAWHSTRPHLLMPKSPIFTMPPWPMNMLAAAMTGIIQCLSATQTGHAGGMGDIGSGAVNEVHGCLFSWLFRASSSPATLTRLEVAVQNGRPAAVQVHQSSSYSAHDWQHLLQSHVGWTWSAAAAALLPPPPNGRVSGRWLGSQPETRIPLARL